MNVAVSIAYIVYKQAIHGVIELHQLLLCELWAIHRM